MSPTDAKPPATPAAPAAPADPAATADPASKSMERIVALTKRRGFVYPASEIYGGLNGFWDYGPLGTLLKNNIRDHWWKHMVECPPLDPDTGEPIQMVGLDSAIIQNPQTWEASGHVGGFSDPMVDCKETKQRFRADHLWIFTFSDQTGKDLYIAHNIQSYEEAVSLKAQLEAGDLPHPYKEMVGKAVARALSKHDWHGGGIGLIGFENAEQELRNQAWAPGASQPGTLTEPRQFNLMLGTEIGAVNPVKAYLRPETAQGIFLNYKNVLDTTRVKVPFGIAQIGKSFRNEVTPRNFIFRSREFEQMEMEWFCHPEDSPKWHAFWKAERMKWWLSLGIDEKNLRFRDHDPDELAHYSKMCVDVEYKYPFTAPGYGELEGVAHRGCFDLTQHQEHAGQKMEYFDQARQLAAKEAGKSKEEIDAESKYIPNVIEPASGLTRAVLVLLCEAYTEDPDRPSGVFMKFHPRFAPIKAAVLPLVNKRGMPEKARELYIKLRERHTVELDVKQNIGKRYARQDEIGTPMCFTIDGQTMEDDTVTVRHRDTLEQERIALDKVPAYLDQRVWG